MPNFDFQKNGWKLKKKPCEAMTKPIEILIADDHPLFRKGLADVLSDEPDIAVVGQAGDGEEAIQLIRKIRPEIAILDIDMPGKNGLDVAEYIKVHQLPVKVIILTMYKDEKRFNRAVNLGIKGYMLKENTIEEVTDSIRTVADNRVYISPLLSEYLLNRIQRSEQPAKTPAYLDQLTPSERKILRMVAEQKTSREIAEELFVSIKTVENHRSNICKKLDLEGSNSLLRFALEHRRELVKGKS
jgi:DNA-binding NarL/FixJ family response regulator